MIRLAALYNAAQAPGGWLYNVHLCIASITRHAAWVQVCMPAWDPVRRPVRPAPGTGALACIASDRSSDTSCMWWSADAGSWACKWETSAPWEGKHWVMVLSPCYSLSGLGCMLLAETEKSKCAAAWSDACGGLVRQAACVQVCTAQLSVMLGPYFAAALKACTAAAVH